MTTPFGDPQESWESEAVDYFDNNLAQGHLLIVRVHDVAEYFRTSNNPDGMVHPTRGATWQPFPNSVVRASVADLSLADETGQRGKVYAEAVIFPSSLTKPMRGWAGAGMKLLMWRKTGPKQTDPYELINMAGNDRAVAAGRDFLTRHPEFLQIPAPAPYIGQAPGAQPPPQGAGNFAADPWAQPQAPAPQAQGWDAPLAPQPTAQNTFLDSFNQHPPKSTPPQNHWGQPQDAEIPF